MDKEWNEESMSCLKAVFENDVAFQSRQKGGLVLKHVPSKYKSKWSKRHHSL
jgi:hypothetical protein